MTSGKDIGGKKLKPKSNVSHNTHLTSKHYQKAKKQAEGKQKGFSGTAAG